MNKERVSYYALVAVGIVAAGIILLVALNYVLPVLLPFLIAWLMASATRAPADFLSRKTKIPTRILRLITSLLLTLLIFSGAAVAIWQLIASLWRFLSDVGEGNKLYDFLTLLTSPKLPIFGDGFSEELAGKITDAVSSMLTSALSWLAEAATDVAGTIPSAFFFLVVTVISLVYFSLDLERINAFCVRVLPENISLSLAKFRDGVFFVIKKYIRSYLLIMLITYLTMLLGFFVLGVEHAPLIALVVALLDILPVIGVGTVLIPWGIIEIALGHRFVGVGLLVLFVVNTVIRQLSEPKIVGKSLDMHPIATLIFLYVGYRLFGFAGLILFPVIAVSLGVILKEDNAAEIG